MVRSLQSSWSKSLGIFLIFEWMVFGFLLIFTCNILKRVNANKIAKKKLLIFPLTRGIPCGLTVSIEDWGSGGRRFESRRRQNIFHGLSLSFFAMVYRYLSFQTWTRGKRSGERRGKWSGRRIGSSKIQLNFKWRHLTLIVTYTDMIEIEKYRS